MNVCVPRVYLVPEDVRRKGGIPWTWSCEHRVGAGNRSWVVEKGTRDSSPMFHFLRKVYVKRGFFSAF